jgi:hypothetical protein
VADVDSATLERSPLAGRRGFDLTVPLQSYAVGADGRARMHGEELDRLEVRLAGDGARDARYAGYARVNGDLSPLPIGSHLDTATGVFTWQPGPGFVRDYDFVFLRCPAAARSAASCGRRELRVTLHPRRTNRVGPQVAIDLPGSPEVGRSFVVAGWAVDLDAGAGTGVDTLHVWAYPVRSNCESAGCDPIFVGATAYGGARPDVGAVLGERFTPSGYALTVDSLPPGTYDLAVFAWSTAQQTFVPAKVVRVSVR